MVLLPATVGGFQSFLADFIQLDAKTSESPDDDPQCTAPNKIMSAVTLAGVRGDHNRKTLKNKTESVHFFPRL